MDFAFAFILAHYWKAIDCEPNYKAMGFKALMLQSLTLIYLQKLLVHTISGRGDSTWVVTDKDFFYLYNKRESLYPFGTHIGLVHLDLGQEIKDQSDPC